MKHLIRISNSGNDEKALFARRSFAWLANRERLMREVNRVPKPEISHWKPIKVAIHRKKRTLREFWHMILV